MDDQTRQHIEELIKNKVMLFMKGNKLMPQCGFSARVVKILNSYGIKYDIFDVLTDDSIREGIKEFTNWPTIPQLYINQKFIGGCDIVTELHNSGELKKILE
ncbi:MAG: Grx4 family monothiol glutaredoxin, partial [Candidatus Nanoarchaeia archaeon]